MAGPLPAGTTAARRGRRAAGRRWPVVPAAALLGALAVAAGAAPAAARPAPTVSPSQELAVLLTAQRVVAAPGSHRSSAATVPAWRPITGAQTVLPVIATAVAAGGARWLRVMLPGRPNGSTGWIAQRGTSPATTDWQIVVKTASRLVLVYRRGRLLRTFSAIVGKPSTPTPHGRFFVEESIRMLPGAAGAPFALATSARSDVLQEFDGGPGQIALHGLDNVGGQLGTAASHGCVRLADSTVAWLADRISPGVPVTIL
jgi:lipoprotein-anchoring transpeptidase ErfK/SrfK